MHGYKGTQKKSEWRGIIWVRSSIPTHTFIAWLFMMHKLPVKTRLQRFTSLQDTLCSLCQSHEEDEDHLFFGSELATEVWKPMLDWWRMKLNVSNYRQCIESLIKHRDCLASEKGMGLENLRVQVSFLIVWRKFLTKGTWLPQVSSSSQT